MYGLLMVYEWSMNGLCRVYVQSVFRFIFDLPDLIVGAWGVDTMAVYRYGGSHFHSSVYLYSSHEFQSGLHHTQIHVCVCVCVSGPRQ